MVIDGAKGTATPTHPFWVVGRGWVTVDHLRPGDALRQPDGTTVTIDAVRATGRTATVYNFEVQDAHDYYVRAGNHWILVHNQCGPVPLGLGSTGRTVPGDLTEQLAMAEVRSAPGGSAVNMRDPMGDPRWPASDGWVKLSQLVNGVDIHYVRNSDTGAVDDFKFANPFNPTVLVQPGRSIFG